MEVKIYREDAGYYRGYRSCPLRGTWNCPLSAWHPANPGSGSRKYSKCQSFTSENDRGRR